MRTILMLSLMLLGTALVAGEQKILNQSEQEIDKTFARDAEFRVDDRSRLVGRVVAGGELKLWVNDRSQVRLAGSAQRVVVQCCEGASELDLRDFVCDEVVFENALTNNSTVYVSAVSSIRFTEKIDDKSVAYVRAGTSVRGPVLKGNSRVFYSGAAPVFKEVDGGATAEARDW